MTGRSPAQVLASLPAKQREAWIKAKGEDAVAMLLADWRFWARPEQLAPPGDWRWWAIVTGRGWGKTRSCAEWVIDRCEAFAMAGAPHLVGLGNRTFGEVRATQIEGDSGLRLAARRRGHVLNHAATAREAELVIRTPAGPHYSRLELHTSKEPDLVRGRNFHTFWHEEFARYFPIRDVDGGTMFTNADLGLRAIGPLPPQGVASTTPRPVPWLKSLLAGEHGTVVETNGALYDNLQNLAPSFVKTIIERYADSPLGPQEIFGRLVEEVEGALWRLARLNATRITADRLPDDLIRVAVGVDPPGEKWGAECGIIGAAVGPAPLGWPDDGKKHLYVIADDSLQGDADEWPAQVVGTARAMAVSPARTLSADVVAAEVNNGGDMVRAVIQVHDGNVYVHKVRASRGKYVRAEPVATLWGPTQARAHIVGYLPDLESQLTTWRPGDDSPDRLDGLVWAAAELLPDLYEGAGQVGVHSAHEQRM